MPIRKLPGCTGYACFSADYHQQYLAKYPNGYCGIGGRGVPFKLAELQVGGGVSVGQLLVIQWNQSRRALQADNAEDP
jgi:hypothetical protein